MAMSSARALYAPVLYAASLWVKMLFWTANQAAELMKRTLIMIMPGALLQCISHIASQSFIIPRQNWQRRAPAAYVQKPDAAGAAPCSPESGSKPPLVISWPGYGILFFWQLGVLQYLTEHFDCTKIPMLGSSAGALIAVLAACNVSAQRALDLAHELCQRHGVFTRPLGLAGVWGGLVRTWLQELLPQHAAQLCSGRATLVVTELRGPVPSPRAHTDFQDKGDLIDVALASAHVPLFLDGCWSAECRGRRCIDGSICYILFGWSMGLAPVDRPVAVFDPRHDTQLWRGWGWSRCLGLTGKTGAQQLMQLGYQYCESLHKAGVLDAFDLDRVALTEVLTAGGQQQQL